MTILIIVLRKKGLSITMGASGATHGSLRTRIFMTLQKLKEKFVVGNYRKSLESRRWVGQGALSVFQMGIWMNLEKSL
jgi:hypothetical protein